MKQSLMQLDGISWFIPRDILTEYPGAIIIKCNCDATNPMNILRVTNEQIAAVTSNAKIYNTITGQFDDIDLLDKLDNLRQTHDLRFIQILKGNLMAFCFIPY